MPDIKFGIDASSGRAGAAALIEELKRIQEEAKRTQQILNSAGAGGGQAQARAAQQAAREASRLAQQQAQEARRASAQQARDTQQQARETQRVAQQAARDAQQTAQKAARDAQQAARQQAREAQQAAAQRTQAERAAAAESRRIQEQLAADRRRAIQQQSRDEASALAARVAAERAASRAQGQQIGAGIQVLKRADPEAQAHAKAVQAELQLQKARGQQVNTTQILVGIEAQLNRLRAVSAAALAASTARQLAFNAALAGSLGVLARMQATVLLLGRGLASFGQQAAAAATRMQAAFDKARNSVEQRWGRALTLGLTAPITAAAAAAVKLELDFRTTFVKIQNLAEESAQGAAQLKQEILDLAPAVGRGPRELAQALYTIESVGFQGAAAMDILDKSAKAAAIGLGDTQIVAKTVVSAILAFKDAGLTATQAMDQLIVAVRLGGAEADQFAGTLGRVVAIAAQAGVSFASVSNFVATFTRLGVDADEAVTALRQALTLLVRVPEKKVVETFQRMGSSVAEFRNQVADKGLTLALIDLVAQAERTGVEVGDLVPNIRSLAGVLATAGAQAEVFAANELKIANASGELNKAFELAQKSGVLAFGQLKAAAETALIVGAEQSGLAHTATILAESLTSLTKSFIELAPQTKTTIGLFFALAAAIGPVTIAMSLLIRLGIVPLLGLLTSLAGAIGTGGAIIVGLGVLAGVFATLGRANRALNESMHETPRAVGLAADAYRALGVEIDTLTKKQPALMNLLEVRAEQQFLAAQKAPPLGGINFQKGFAAATVTEGRIGRGSADTAEFQAVARRKEELAERLAVLEKDPIIVQFKVEIEKVSDQIAALPLGLSEARTALVAQKEVLVAGLRGVTEAQQILIDYPVKIASLRARMEQLDPQDALDQKAAATLSKQIQELQNLIDIAVNPQALQVKYKIELANLDAEIAALDSAGAIKAGQLLQKRDELQAKVEASTAAAPVVAEYKIQLASLDKQIDALNSEDAIEARRLVGLRSELQALVDRTNASSPILVQYKMQLAALDQQIAALDTADAVKVEQLYKARSELQALVDAANTSEPILARYKIKLAALDAQIATLDPQDVVQLETLKKKQFEVQEYLKKLTELLPPIDITLPVSIELGSAERQLTAAELRRLGHDVIPPEKKKPATGVGTEVDKELANQRKAILENVKALELQAAGMRGAALAAKEGEEALAQYQGQLDLITTLTELVADATGKFSGQELAELVERARAASIEINELAAAERHLKEVQGIEALQFENEVLRDRARAAAESTAAIDKQVFAEIRLRKEFEFRTRGTALSPREQETAILEAQENARLEQQIEIINKGKEAQKQATEESAKQYQELWSNTIENTQKAFGDMFTDVINGGENAFKSFGDFLRQMFSRLAGEIAAMLVFKPIVGALQGAGAGGAAGILGGGGGGGAGANLNFLSSLTDAVASGFDKFFGGGGGSGGAQLGAFTAAQRPAGFGVGLLGGGGAGSMVGSGNYILSPTGTRIVGFTSGSPAQGTGFGAGIGRGGVPPSVAGGVDLGAAASSAVAGAGGILAGYKLAQQLLDKVDYQSEILFAKIGSVLGGIVGAVFGGIFGGTGGAAIGGFVGAVAGGALLQGAAGLIESAKSGRSIFETSSFQQRFNRNILLSGDLVSALVISYLGKNKMDTNAEIATRSNLADLQALGLQGFPGLGPGPTQESLIPENVRKTPFGFIGLVGSGSGGDLDTKGGKGARAILDTIRAVDTSLNLYLTETERQIIEAAEIGQLHSNVRDTGKVVTARIGAVLTQLGIPSEIQANVLNQGSIGEQVKQASGLLEQRKEIIQFLNELRGTAEPITESSKALAKIAELFRNIAVSGPALGVVVDDLDALRDEAIRQVTETFNDVILDGIRAFTDPASLALDTLAKQQEERLREAIAIGGSLVEVERLTGLERVEALKQINAPIQGLLDQLQLSPGGQSPTQAFGFAEQRFFDIATGLQQKTGEFNTQDLAASAQAFLSLGEQFLGAPSFAAQREEIMGILESFLVDLLPGDAQVTQLTNLNIEVARGNVISEQQMVTLIDQTILMKGEISLLRAQLDRLLAA